MINSIDLEFFLCSFVLNTFVQYTGVNVPDNLAIEVETILDAGAAVPRAFFQKQEGVSRMNVTYELGKNQQRNNSQYVYIPVRSVLLLFNCGDH